MLTFFAKPTLNTRLSSSTRYYAIKHEVLDLLMRWNRVAATHDGWRDESISPTNYTNGHKYYSAISD